jgi:hypothetical protein
LKTPIENSSIELYSAVMQLPENDVGSMVMPYHLPKYLEEKNSNLDLVLVWNHKKFIWPPLKL